MATIVRTKEGTWRAQVRRKGKYASQTFCLKTLASEWVAETERPINIGCEPTSRKAGKPIRRSKRAVLVALKRDLGATRITHLDQFALIKYGKMRAKQSAGPVTLSIDFSYMHTIITHAAEVHGIAVDTENLCLARTALTRLGLIGRANERDRHPSDDEIEELLAYFDNKTNMIIPMGRVFRFAVATAMRLEKIFAIEWPDVDLKKRVIIIRNRKDPRHKDGNDQKIPILNQTGFDAWQLLLEQKILTCGQGRVFPYHHKSAGTVFRRGRNALGIEDLRSQ